MQPLKEPRGGGGEYQRVLRNAAACDLHRESESVPVSTADRAKAIAAAAQA